MHLIDDLDLTQKKEPSKREVQIQVNLNPYTAMAENSFIGQIIMFAGKYVIEGWLPCDGREMSIQQNQVLYSIIGTDYGGDGVRVFKLPNLNDRFPMSARRAAQGAVVAVSEGVDKYEAAQMNVAVELPAAKLPAHSHEAVFNPGSVTVDPVTIGVVSGNISTDTTNMASPKDNRLAVGFPPSGINAAKVYSTAAANAELGGVTGGKTGQVVGASVSITPTGDLSATQPSIVKGTLSFPERSNIPPYLSLNFLICVEGGEYPPQRIE